VNGQQPLTLIAMLLSHFSRLLGIVRFLVLIQVPFSFILLWTKLHYACFVPTRCHYLYGNWTVTMPQTSSSCQIHWSRHCAIREWLDFSSITVNPLDATLSCVT